MKKLLILPAIALALASCAPAVTQSPIYSASREYRATCAQALNALNDVAIRTRPAVLIGASGWSPLAVVDRSENRVVYASQIGSAIITYGVISTIKNAVTVSARCTEANGAASLTLDSSGQGERLMTPLNNSLLDGIPLPR